MESQLNKPKDKNADWKNKVRSDMGLPNEAVPTELPRLEIEPFHDLVWAWNGFWRLSNVRPVGFNGVLRVPMNEIEAYARLHSFDYSRRTDFLYYVEQLDGAYMAFVDKRREERERLERNKSGEIGGKQRRKFARAR